MNIFDYMDEYEYEELAMYTDKQSGLRALVCIHDTTLGPACGGSAPTAASSTPWEAGSSPPRTSEPLSKTSSRCARRPPTPPVCRSPWAD